MVIIAWKLWEARNAFLWSNQISIPSHILNSARGLLEEYKSASQSLKAATAVVYTGDAPSRLAHIHHQGDWLAFVDGAIFEASDFMGFGLTIEDAEDYFSLAISGFEEGGSRADIAEAIALRQCLCYARDSLFDPGCIFTDCQSLFFAINSLTDDGSEFSLIVSDCKVILVSRPNIKVFWIRRRDNRCAHLLARDSIRHSRFHL